MLARDKHSNIGEGETRLQPHAEGGGAKGALARAGHALGRRRFRLLAGAAAVLVALIATAGAMAPWLYSPSAAMSAVSGQLQKATGLYVALQGAPRLSLTPRPHVSIDGVAFADRSGALVIEAQSLHGILKLLPLLSGRLDVEQWALVKPRARLDLDRQPIDAPGAVTRAAAARSATPEAQDADDARLGLLGVVDGSLHVRRDAKEFVFEKIDATLDWRRIGQPAALTGAFDWRGERLQAMLWVARPGALLRGDPAVATARLDGENLKLEAQGVAQTGVNARYSGHVAGSAVSVRDALKLFDLEAPLPGPFGDAQFSAEAVLSAHEATLRALDLHVDGNAFTGELDVRAEDGRPNVSARLQSSFVALKPMLSDAPALVGPDGQWSREPLDPPDLTGADMDLTLTARHARLGRLSLDDAQVSASLRDGVLDLSLLEARAYRGRLKARASFKAAGDALSVHATAQTSGVDARALLWDAFGRQALAGGLDATLTLDGSGGTMIDLMRSLNGRAAMTLSDGEIAGVDFERALRRLEKRPLSSAQDIRSGSSALDSASVKMRVENGVGALEDGAARGPGFSLTFGGEANFGERSLSLKAAAREADGGGKPREKGLQIAFDLAGGWDELSLAPDPQAFIRRSGAAAPLLPEPPREGQE